MTLDNPRETIRKIILAHRPINSGPGFIECACRWVGGTHSEHLTDALLPVVDRIANERAAAELRAAGRAIQRIGFGAHDDVAMIPLNRADALDPT